MGGRWDGGGDEESLREAGEKELLAVGDGYPESTESLAVERDGLPAQVAAPGREGAALGDHRAPTRKDASASLEVFREEQRRLGRRVTGAGPEAERSRRHPFRGRRICDRPRLRPPVAGCRWKR
jgi:hypothetical protein